MSQNNAKAKRNYFVGPKRIISMVKSMWNTLKRHFADRTPYRSTPEREDVQNNEQATNRSAGNGKKSSKLSTWNFSAIRSWISELPNIIIHKLKIGILLIFSVILSVAGLALLFVFLALPAYAMYKDFSFANGAGNKTSYVLTLRTANNSHLPTPMELIGQKYNITGTMLMELQNRISNIGGISSETNSTVDPEVWKQHEREFCKGLDYFYNLHFEYAHDYGKDWFDAQIDNLYGRQIFIMVLFFSFVLYFQLTYSGAKLPTEHDKCIHLWIALGYIYYMTSSAVVASIRAEVYGEGGLRCAMCRFTDQCQNDDDKDFLLGLFIPKLVDCVINIGLAAVWFVRDTEKEYSSWLIRFQIIGVLVAAPFMIFAPTMAVLICDDGNYLERSDIPRSMAAILFYIGTAFWSAFLSISLLLYIRWKIKNCSGAAKPSQTIS